MGEKIASIDNKYGHMIIVALSAVSGALLGALVYLVKDVPTTTFETSQTMKLLVPAVEKLAKRVDENTVGISQNTTDIAITAVDRAGVRKEFELIAGNVNGRLAVLEAKAEIASRFDARITNIEGELKSRAEWRDSVLDNTKTWRQRTTNELKNHKH